MEEDHYYPYVLKHTNYNSNKKEYGFEEEKPDELRIKAVPDYEDLNYKYKYNGKEWQDDLGLNMYAMDLRQYDPAIARWVVQDPVVHHSQSPYNGYDSNPVYWADPSGATTTDALGRNKFDWRGIYISSDQREDENIVIGSNITSDNATHHDPPATVAKDGVSVLQMVVSVLGGPYRILSFIAGGLLSSAHSPDFENAPYVVRPFSGTFSRSDVRDLSISNDVKQRKGKDGSYTIYFQGGRKYHGKGPLDRMFKSALFRMWFYKKTVMRLDWTPAESSREAFKQEYRRMQTDATTLYPEGYANPINQNIIQSPGKNYILQDGF